ncbi:MAG: helix-turn-helix domain-containing protein [Fuerstiella sp.]|nr:helix-turn-helix domain-containing protein [Fuerstiella sp.]
MSREISDCPVALKRSQVCDMLQISARQLSKLLKADNDFPTPFTVGGSLRWKRETIVAWMETQISKAEVAQ